MDNKKEYQKDYSLANRKQISERQAEWYIKNREKNRIRDRNYKRKHKDHINKIRKFYKSYNQKPDKVKSLARRQVQSAIERGELAKLPCEVCGDIKVQAHHEDYSKPLQVIWLCSTHHGERHIKSI